MRTNEAGAARDSRRSPQINVTPLHPARFKALVPEEPQPLPRVRPDPLMLVVTIDGESRLRLNRGAILGMTSEMSKLAEALAEQFRLRVEAGTWRRDSAADFSLPPPERSERTVFIKAPRSLRYGEVARVVDAIRGAGANPVGLQIDELEP